MDKVGDMVIMAYCGALQDDAALSKADFLGDTNIGHDNAARSK